MTLPDEEVPDCLVAAEPAPVPGLGKPRHVVAVDVDEVLLKYSEGFVRWQFREAGKDQALPDVGACFSAACNKSMVASRDAFGLTEAFLSLDLVPGALQALQRLKELDVRVEVITSRPASMQEATEKALANAFPGLIAKAHFSKSGEKGRICRSIGACALVDDQGRNVSDAAKAAVLGILFDLDGAYTWNKASKVPKSVVRLKSWEEVIEHLQRKWAHEEASGAAPHVVEKLRSGEVEEHSCWSHGSSELPTDAESTDPPLQSRPGGNSVLPSLGDSPASWQVGGFLEISSPSRLPKPPDLDPSPSVPEPPLEEETEVAEPSAEEAAEPEAPVLGSDEDPVAVTLLDHESQAQLDISKEGNTVAVHEEPCDIPPAPLLTGYFLKKRRTKAIWFARSVLGTPVQPVCWRSRYFEVGPGDALSYWSALDDRQEQRAARGQFSLATGKASAKGKDVVIDLEKGRHRWLYLRAASPSEADHLAKACQAAAAGPDSALFALFMTSPKAGPEPCAVADVPLSPEAIDAEVLSKCPQDDTDDRGQAAAVPA